MSLENVRRIRETYDESEVNEYLSRGFRLVKILSSRKQVGGCEEVKPVYVLALFEE